MRAFSRRLLAAALAATCIASLDSCVLDRPPETSDRSPENAGNVNPPRGIAAARGTGGDNAALAAPAPPAPRRLGVRCTRSGSGIVTLQREGADGSLGLRLTVHDDSTASRGEIPDWNPEGDSCTAQAETDDAAYELRLEPDPRRERVFVKVSARYRRTVAVSHADVGIEFLGVTAASVLGRDMVTRPAPSRRPYLTDRWTPLEVALSTPIGSLLLSRRKGFDTVQTVVGQGGLSARLEFDDSRNHPFTPYAECLAEYSSRVPYRELSAVRRESGDWVSHEAEIRVAPELVARLHRLPAGRDAAVVLTSHADQSSPATTRAILWGNSNRDSPEYGRRGIAGNGLSMTLSAWAAGGGRGDLGRPEFAAVVDDAWRAGIEICPHSPTKLPDSRERVSSLLEAYRKFDSLTWIDHEPEVNCEATNSRGITSADRGFGIADLLGRAGYRFLWSIPDTVPPGGVNLFGPDDPDYRPTFLYRNPFLERGAWHPWNFKSIWRFLKRGTFLRQYSGDRLDRLTAERGIHIAHVYLDTFQEGGRLRGKTLLERDGSGFRVRDDAEAVLERLGARQRRGEIWVASLRDLADHLTALPSVSVDYEDDGTILVAGAERDIAGLTISVPLRDAVVLIDGKPPLGTKSVTGETLFWFDLRAGVQARIRVAKPARAQ